MRIYLLRLAVLSGFLTAAGACTAGNYDLPVCLDHELCGNGLDDDCDGVRDNPDICKCVNSDGPRPCPLRPGIVTNKTNPASICTDDIQVCLPNMQWSSCKGVDPIIEKCGNGFDDDCDGGVDDQDAEGCVKCVDGETQTLATPSLTYGPTSLCKIGVQDCQSGTWVTRPGFEPVGPRAGDNTCDGFDDDCDGKIDEDVRWKTFSVGSVCFDDTEIGACRTAGVVGCNAGSATCNRPVQAKDDVFFHRYAANNVYTQTNINNAEWDWNCNSKIESIFCYGSADTCKSSDVTKTIHVVIDGSASCNIVRGSDLCNSVVIKPMPGESFVQCGSQVLIVDCQLVGLGTCGDSASVRTGYLYCR